MSTWIPESQERFGEPKATISLHEHQRFHGRRLVLGGFHDIWHLPVLLISEWERLPFFREVSC